jgi:hypothetical protein
VQLTRRTFLSAAGACLAAPLAAQLQQPETLYNGVALPYPWPPRRLPPSGGIERPPYLAAPPAVVDAAIGRQLFVDDFLIEENALRRVFHPASYHPASPVLRPEREWELHDQYAIDTNGPPSASAMPYSDGVFFDPRDGLFKLWYMAGYQQATALATSGDGINWERPRLPIVPGTNIVMQHRRDSNTVWLDLGSPARDSRYKMATFVFKDAAMRLSESTDGIRWRPAGITGPCADRSTFFWNPFRKVWVFSLRADVNGTRRYRRYFESRSFAATSWSADEPVAWVGADVLDPPRPDLHVPTELYNLDAVAYESLILGLFTIFRGETSIREKPNDICVAFSRDGFHWDRSARQPFVTVSETPGAWNWGNVQSAGGGCLVVGDQLYFYVSGRAGIPGTNLPGACSTGLAILRRDGFASLTDEWPAGTPRPALRDRSSVITRPLKFDGSHLFINASADGEIRVDVLERNGSAIAGYSAAECNPIRGDRTKHHVSWRSRANLESLRGREIRLRFTLSRSRLYSFWISRTEAGHSRGYVAAGGPGFTKVDDAP